MSAAVRNRGYLAENALDANDLTPGPIPDFLQNLNLEVLDLYDTNRTGDIPAWLGTKINLLNLNLGKNSFNPGPVPDLRGLTGLAFLQLQESNRTGDLPAWLGSLTHLVVLNLDLNSALNPGPIPDLSGLTKATACASFTDLPPPCLVELGLAGTNRTGIIPDSLASFANLEVLPLDKNHLTGGFPPSLTTLSNLLELGLDGNRLTGTLPDALTKMTNLTYADFRWNAFQASGATAAFVNAREWDLYIPAPIRVDFRNTQTTPPRFGLAVTGATSSSLTLHWNRIRYTSDAGFYSVFMSDRPSGPWALAKRVPGGKTATQVTLSGLQSNKTYYFYLATTTLPNADNPNNVKSVPGPVFSGKTTL